ncbi:MAG: hypothetical protein N3F62_04885 [Bacteroidia bacterium]|nr:hypothetical protein [Bacteroidia bacterium]
MKKQNLIFITLLLPLHLLIAQSFTGNSLLLYLNVGIEALNTEYTYKIKNTGIDTLIKDKAANSNYFLGIEYGPLKWLGIGIKAKINKYFTEKDKITNTQPDANSFDIAFTLRTHLFRKKHFDLPIGISIGGSSLTYNNNDPNDPITVNGKGTYFDIHIQPMFYFDKLGLNLFLGLPSVNYSDMSFNKDILNEYVLAQWKGKGLILGLGLQYRIIN